MTESGSNSKVIPFEVTEKLQFDFNAELGRGMSSIVYKGSFEGMQVAVKRIKCKDALDAQERVDLFKKSREIEIMKTIETERNQNIIGYYGSALLGMFIHMAMELFQGSLVDYVKSENLVASYPPKKVNIDIASGVDFLHSRNIVHRDLKPANVFFKTKDGYIARIVIGDFGTSKHSVNDMCTWTEISGTGGYIAAEVWDKMNTSEDVNVSIKHSMSTKSDIFAQGCVYFYTVTRGSHPFGKKAQTNIQLGVQPTLEENVTSDDPFKQLLSIMLDHNPVLRPTAKQVTEHPAFWSSERALNFLSGASDELMNSTKGKMTQFENLNIPNPNPNPNWITVLPINLKEYLQNYELVKQDGKKVKLYLEYSKTVFGLLRAIRNITNHHKELPPKVLEELGMFPEGHAKFWMRHYPFLLMHVYWNTKGAKMKPVRRQGTIPMTSYSSPNEASSTALADIQQVSSQYPVVLRQTQRYRKPDDSYWRTISEEEFANAKACGLKNIECNPIVLCIDISESMSEGEKWSQTKLFVTDTLKGLSLFDRQSNYVSIVTFGHKTEVVHRLSNNYAELLDDFNKITLGGPTPMFGGVMLACASLAVPILKEEKPICVVISDCKPTETNCVEGPDTANDKNLEDAKRRLVHALKDDKECKFIFVPVGNFDETFLEFMITASNGKSLYYEEGKAWIDRVFGSVRLVNGDKEEYSFGDVNTSSPRISEDTKTTELNQTDPSSNQGPWTIQRSKKGRKQRPGKTDKVNIADTSDNPAPGTIQRPKSRNRENETVIQNKNNGKSHVRLVNGDKEEYSLGDVNAFSPRVSEDTITTEPLKPNELNQTGPSDNHGPWTIKRSKKSRKQGPGKTDKVNIADTSDKPALGTIQRPKSRGRENETVIRNKNNGKSHVRLVNGDKEEYSLGDVNASSPRVSKDTKTTELNQTDPLDNQGSWTIQRSKKGKKERPGKTDKVNIADTSDNPAPGTIQRPKKGGHRGQKSCKN